MTQVDAMKKILWVAPFLFLIGTMTAPNANAGFIDELKNICSTRDCVNSRPVMLQSLGDALIAESPILRYVPYLLRSFIQEKIALIPTYISLIRNHLNPTASVPEPGSFGLMLGGLSLIGLMGWRRRQAMGLN